MKRFATSLPVAGLLEILVPGAIGLFVVARALAFYWGKDQGAALLVVAMGVGLTVGLVELLLRSRGATALAREVRGLPQTLDDQGLTRLSPTLRDLLRARIEQAPAPFRIESITPYLVGLMVMLGLLGTLLGLFETLSGAGHALTASNNVEALRNGLSGPMRGLTRSFGCSAAGVSASAMLGLAAALVRRREAKTVALIYSYANGPLRALSPVRSQLSALQQLADQGGALPKAAQALELTAQQLLSMSERWDKGHQQLAERWEKSHLSASENQQRGLEQALVSMRNELAKAAAEAGRAMHTSLAQQVEQLVQKTAESISTHVAKTTRTLEDDLRTRREGDAALRKTLHDELAKLPQQVGSLVEQTARALEEDMRARREGDAALRETLHDELSKLPQQVGSLVEQTSRAVAEHLTSTKSALEQELALRQEGDSSLRENLRLELATLREGDAALRQAYRDELTTLRAGLLQSDKEQSALVTAQIATVEQALKHATEQQLSLLAAQRSQADAHMEALGETARALAGRLDEDARARRDESERQFGDLARKLDQAGDNLGKLAEGVGEQLRARLAAESNVAEQSRAAMALLEQSGKALEDALTRHDLAVEALVEQGGAQLVKIANTAQESAGAAVARVIELAAAQSDRLAQLEAQLEAAQAKHVQGLSEQLTAHAGQLGKGLEGTSGLVQEAAGLLKASSIEMAAVAELFAKSVERQREAANSWMESLGELEGAVERAGRGAAADALGDQLASTQEVFARQLQFQRELFEQLRSLRHAPTPSIHEEHDVSA